MTIPHSASGAPDENAAVRFSGETLADTAGALFRAAGSPAEEAATVARLLVAANLAGHDSHGVARIPQYLRNLRRGRGVPGEGPVCGVIGGGGVRVGERDFVFE